MLSFPVIVRASAAGAAATAMGFLVIGFGDHAADPVGSETMMPLPHGLPRAEPLGKITPRHPGAIPEHDPSTTWR